MQVLQPLGDRVIVRQDAAPEVTDGGLEIPERSQSRPCDGEVLLVGPGSILQDGSRSPMDVSVGDRIQWTRYAGKPIDPKDTTLLVMSARDIIGIYREGEAGDE